MAKLRFAPRAQADLRAIADYSFAAYGRAAALTLLDEIEHHAMMLADMPNLGRARAEIAPGLRSLPFEPFVIFYNPIDEGIEVARIRHSAQDISEL